MGLEDQKKRRVIERNGAVWASTGVVCEGLSTDPAILRHSKQPEGAQTVGAVHCTSVGAVWKQQPVCPAG